MRRSRVAWRTTRVAATLRAVRARLADWAEQDAARLGLWSPAALGAGAAVYLQLDREPPPFLPIVLALALLAISVALGRGRAVWLAAAFFLLGFAAADIRASIVDAPILQKRLDFVEVEGRIRTIDEGPRQRRIVLDVRRIDRVKPVDLPARVRITWRGDEFNARPGDLVSLRASLSPPPRPAAPGGFDFARQLYFLRIGGVGFAVAPPRVLPEARKPFDAGLAARLETVRVNLSRRILAEAESDGGAIVAAVVTGKRGAISEESEAAFRDSGLAHLLSISGLHMGLATGLIFFGFRAFLAAFESLALTQPIKKWAAAAALISGGLYLAISGGAWPAQRAFIMTSIFFVAIIFDRRALSLRNVSIAAFIIILLTPEAVLHPGFQMSFAAVTALIAVYEWASKRAEPSRSFSLFARLRRYFTGIAITDTVAAGATAPFSLFHFNRTANFGLPANIISIPLMGFWVMPAAIIAMMLAPLNLDGGAWRLAASGVDVMLAMGRWTRELPGAVTVFPQWPPAALGVLSVGGLWLCLMSAFWRYFGMLSIPLAACLIAAHSQPVLFISEDADNVGYVRHAEGGKPQMAVLDRRKSRFDVDVWMEQAGIDSEKTQPLKIADLESCDAIGCVIHSGEVIIAIASRQEALDDDCARADLVIALYFASVESRRACAAQIVDRSALLRDGAHAVYLSRGDIRISTVAELRGRRPWSHYDR
ncbi:MAG: ComEC/Rec2 family competence protein [Parvularculaceae bacterium]|nr:ComEC/Rec2 family competence protein [Parvularculaceae bacterium]